MSKIKFTFPVEYHEFHKDQGINFQRYTAVIKDQECKT